MKNLKKNLKGKICAGLLLLSVSALAVNGCGATRTNDGEAAVTESGAVENSAAEITSEDAAEESGAVEIISEDADDDPISMESMDEAAGEEADVNSSEGGELPAYTYDGDTDIAAICDYLTGVVAASYDAADVSIPYMRIVDKDDTDPDDVLVWGNFWVMNYDLNGDILEAGSGGNYPGLMHLKQQGDGSYEVTDFEVVGDGSDFIPSAKKIFGDRYDAFTEAQSDSEAMEEIRAEFIRGYVEANGLNITAYQDYGWEPVLLESK